jgi:hypothetical protein
MPESLPVQSLSEPLRPASDAQELSIAPASIAPASPARRRRRVSPARQALFTIILIGMTLGCLEVGARLYWTIRGLDFWSCQRHVIRAYYPILNTIRQVMRPAGTSAQPQVIDVLIMGGSVVNPALGPIPTMLMERLTRDLNCRVNLFNVAAAAHGSRDSYFKFKDLGDKRFDLVIVYHAINDLRANNCPDDMFQADYGHIGWYRLLNAADAGADRRLLALPVTLRLAWIRLTWQLGLARVLPDGASVIPKWVTHGSKIKTAEPFRRNMEAIVEMARQRQEPIVLMTFANYLPKNYTRQKFEARQLDYCSHWFATEIWGVPRDVVKGLAVHNAVIRDLARAHPETIFVDEQAMMPADGRYYDDICHLSTAGCARFVDNLVPAIEPGLRKLLDERDRQAGQAVAAAPLAQTRRSWDEACAEIDGANEAPIVH